MLHFPSQLFSDVRIEEVYSTAIVYENGGLTANQIRRETGAFLRVYDGAMWYYAATTDLDNLQQELDSLAAMAAPNPDILTTPTVQRLQANRDKVLRCAGCCVDQIPNRDKAAKARHYHDLLAGSEGLAGVKVRYSEEYRRKHIFSSIGCDVEWDYQHCGLAVSLSLNAGPAPFTDACFFYGSRFDDMGDSDSQVLDFYRRCLDFALHAKPVIPGKYPVILSPETAGVFAHESFGHKSEADFMLGDESMLRAWAMGSQVGAPMLSIYDDGSQPGSGYLPYDDEGVKKERTWLIRDGILAGRLHSAGSAAALNEAATGNARAVSFEFEPIVRMTSTCIAPGSQTREELFAGVKEGVYIHDYNHGSGMSTFTIAPAISYMIRDGKLAEPVRVSVISGNVMETLGLIDGLSDGLEVRSSAFGGCGKMEQFPLRVSDGGPYVRVSSMNVQ